MRSQLRILLPVAAIIFLAIFPQLFFVLKTEKWHGSYFVSNYDEPAYSAYVNALMSGEPRKNDPFVGLSDTSATPQPETFYSIQFIPAYAIAIPARMLGINVSTAFIFLAVFIAGFSAIAIRKLLLETTGDEMLSSIGPVAILCLGTAVAFQGELRNLLTGGLLADFLPFLRRYQPGFAFPLFFVFCLLFYRAVNKPGHRERFVQAAVAGVLFAVLVFSYFYLWTAAAAWMTCFAIVFLICKKDEWRSLVVPIAITGGIGLIAIVPYFLMLAERSADLDSVQLLGLTRMPQLVSPSLIIGLIVAVAAIYTARKSESKANLPFVMLLSFALTPVILFNQQVVTGRSLQPVHYELFIANYMVLTSAVTLAARWWPSASNPSRDRILTYAASIIFAWGVFEAYGSTNRALTVAEIRDGSWPAIQAAASSDTSKRQVILATNFVTGDIIPSIPNTRSYWNPHTSSAGGIGVEQNKNLFYKYLYFSGNTEKDLEQALRANSFEVTAAIFGSERALPSLGSDSQKITVDEIRSETQRFAEFVRKIDSSQALEPKLDHLIVPAEAEPSFANVDKLYVRDQGQTFGLFKLYKLTSKTAQ